MSRNLAGLTAEPRAFAAAEPTLPLEFNWRDYSILLLHVAAEIEHSLMVQYLFAAYSLGGPQVPAQLRDRVRAWQETILGIAKEEMGHLVTVQNLLKAFGAPLNFNREDYPWDSDFYPFPFTLQRLSLDALATYVCAESPEGWTGAQADEIRGRAAAGAQGAVNRVGALYSRILAILGSRAWIPDSEFQAHTLPYQASWDEWGRGYARGQRGQEAGNVATVLAPDLIILRVSSRTTALAAIARIGEQGEGIAAVPDCSGSGGGGESSHFCRFLSIYNDMVALDEADLALVTRPVASNPRTSQGLDENTMKAVAAVAGPRPVPASHEITTAEGLHWGHLFNLRYRMLLVNLSHALRLAGPSNGERAGATRGVLIHRSFGEMYNLRAIAGVLMQIPLDAADPTGDRAGPPFEMPYTLHLPDIEHDCWLLHRDLYGASQLLIRETRKVTSVAAPDALDYLTALDESDRLALSQVGPLLTGRPR